MHEKQEKNPEVITDNKGSFQSLSKDEAYRYIMHLHSAAFKLYEQGDNQRAAAIGRLAYEYSQYWLENACEQLYNVSCIKLDAFRIAGAHRAKARFYKQQQKVALCEKEQAIARSIEFELNSK